MSLLGVTLLLTGCLPVSCNRKEARALFPSDSLSRRLAEQLPVDTLTQLWMADAIAIPGIEHPRTVAFGPDGLLYVSDTERHRIYVLDADGTLAREIALPNLRFPYLAGVRGDTLLVFDPENRRVNFVVDEAVARFIETPAVLPGASPLQYVAASDSAVYFKVVAEDAGGYIAVLEGGEIADSIALSGPYWRYAGLLRTWGDTLVSLSGYRPVVDVLTPSGRLDTLALAGFDSPMLARSRQFVLGEVDEAPLLSASAAAAGELLFVLNMRPGWLRIDAYDHSGRLQHILVQEDPSLDRSYYPLDLAARRTPGGAYEFAIVTASPEPAVSLYRWAP